jgi:hypothetical protein
MPALPNPRHERYAQEFFKGLSNGITQHDAYKAAGYLPSNKNSAKACASRLMLTIANRVRELQEESNKRVQHKVDLSRERVGRRLDLASRMAEEQRNAQGIVASELGIAKVFGLEQEQESKGQELIPSDSTRDIAMKVLRSVGLREPDALSVDEAIKANDVYVSTLEDIVSRAQAMACTRFRRHRVRCFDGAGGGSWRDGSLPASSSLRLCV